VDFCRAFKGNHRVVCRGHWYALPAATREEIWASAAMQLGTMAHARLCARTLAWLNERARLHRALPTEAHLVDLRVLTFQQPWLWAIDSLPLGERKDVENRDKRIPSNLLGGWFAAHAGLEWDAEGAADMEAMGIKVPGPNDVPRGVITSLIQVPVQFELGVVDKAVVAEASSRWAFGPWCYVVGSVLRLFKAVLFRGMPGFTVADPATKREILAQLRKLRVGKTAEPFLSALVGPRLVVPESKPVAPVLRVPPEDRS
jgi:hypothetical protein